jgi:D-glutamate cyclase
VASTESSISSCYEAIDRLITVDVSDRGVVYELYKAARARTDKPLVLMAAQALQRVLPDEKFVFISTGWPDRMTVDPTVAETDGPPGAVVVARAIHQAYGTIPIFLIEQQLVPAFSNIVGCAGFKLLSPESVLLARDSKGPIHPAAVLPFPVLVEDAKYEAIRLFDLYSPGAVIVIEKGGMNGEGLIYSCRGENVTDSCAKVDQLVMEARKRRKFTLGIGDGGNEIGMGVIHAEAARVLARGFGEAGPIGFAPSIPTDALLVAAVSNWGAYGIAASLSMLLKQVDVFHNEDIERRLLEGCARAGFIDGVTGYVGGSVDGIPMGVHLALVRIMRSIVERTSRGSYI